MKLYKGDLKLMFVVALMTAPLIAFLAFDFVFPNISSPSLQKNMLVAFLLSLLFGMPSGYILRRTDLAILNVLLYVGIGYVIAIVAYSAPFLFYEFEVVFPGLYFLFFLNRTVILVILFIIGGIIGAAVGQIVGESTQNEETAQWFSKGGR